MTPKPRIQLVAAVAVALSLVASACSGDDDSDTSDTGDETVAATTDDDGNDETGSAGTVDGGDAPELDGEGLTVGFIQPPVGLFDLLGAAQLGGLQLAAQHIADGGGVLGGPLNITSERPTPEDGVEGVFDGFIADDTRLVIGPSSSEEALTLIPKLASDDAVICGASTTAPGLPEIPEADGRFVRTSFDDNIVAVHTFDRVRERTASIVSRPPKVTIAARGDAYGDGVSNSLGSLLTLVGTEVSYVRYVPENVQLDGVGEEVAATTPDLTVLIALDEGPRLARLIGDAGVAPDTMMGLDGFATPRFVGKANIEDPDAWDDFTAIGATGPVSFLTEVVEEPDGLGEVLYAAQAYDCAISMALAVEAVGSADPAAVSTALREVTGGGTICTTYATCLALLRDNQDIDYDGPSGPIDLTPEGEPGGGRFVTAALEAGTFVIVADLRISLDQIRDRVAPRLAGFIGDMQIALTQLGYYTGPIDGTMNDEFVASIEAFQTDNGLEVTGELDAPTIAAIQEALAENGLILSASITEVQLVLTDLGYYTGPIDGLWSQELSDAIRALQGDLGIPQTGILDAATLRAIYEAGVNSGGNVEPPPTTTTTVPDTTTTTTVPDSTTVPPTTPPTTPTTPPTTPTTPPSTAPATTSIYDVLAADPVYSELVALLDSGVFEFDGLKTEWSDPATAFTVLAPTNDALPDDPDLDDQAVVTALVDTLTYQTLTQAFDTSALVAGTYDTNLDRNGAATTLEITVNGPTITANGDAGSTADVVGPSVPGGASFVFPVDGLLTPPAP